MSPRQVSAGHAIVSQLEALGIQRIYCVPGESYLDVLDGLFESEITTVVCRQEGSAGFMAIADSRLSGRFGVAMVTRGPGAANAFIAVHTAWQDRTPLILFVGLVPIGDRYRESFQEFDLTGWFGTTAKAVMTLDSADRATELVADAAHIACSGRPGPVVIGLPEDVLVERVPSDLTPRRACADGSFSAVEQGQWEQALRSASRPLLVVGGDRWTAQSAADLTTWAEEWEVPIVTDWRSQDIIDNDSACYAGWLGYGRNEATAALLDTTDLACFVGCGNADVLSDGYRLGAPDRRTVVVDVDPTLRPHHGPLDLHILATPAAFVRGLQDLRPGQPEVGWPSRCRRAHQQQQDFAGPRADGPATGVDLAAAMDQLARRLPPDAVVTYGAGNHALWAQRYLTHHRYPSLLAPRNGAMGFGVPAAVAASIAQPTRQVVSVTGDGDFLMNGQELATAMTYGAAPLIVIIDNGMYGTIRQHQQREYPGRISGTALQNPHFAEFARSFGAFGQTVGTTAELGPALDAALGSRRAAVLHVLADPAVLAPTSGSER